jgi:hypothetical protein
MTANALVLFLLLTFYGGLAVLSARAVFRQRRARKKNSDAAE